MAGTGTVTGEKVVAPVRGMPPHIQKVVFTWTSDANGDVSDGTFVLRGKVWAIVTDPGATAPTADYDVTLLDEYSTDVLGGSGADRHTSNTERAAITAGVADGTVTPTIANAGNAKVGVVYFYCEA